jgi:geranylgeranyl diphosphate synthase, type II
MTLPDEFQTLLGQWRARTESQLNLALQTNQPGTERLIDAMRYSSLGGGKRLRPVLVYCTGEALGADIADLDAAAVAVELIHVYSLVHDDLPAMDDDDLRRGRPTCHRAYDEGTAVLVGDALQALAFEILSGAHGNARAPARLQQVCLLARAIGTAGMAGGQAIDLGAVGKPLTSAALENMHRCKTGALIQASVQLAAIAAGHGSGQSFDSLSQFAAELGLAFQIQDDVLDVIGATEALGKIAGADAARGKPTYPSVHGLAASRQMAQDHAAAALSHLHFLGDRNRHLTATVEMLVERGS